MNESESGCAVMITRELAALIASKEGVPEKLAEIEWKYRDHTKGTPAFAQAVLTAMCGVDLFYDPRSREFFLHDDSSPDEGHIRAYLKSLETPPVTS